MVKHKRDYRFVVKHKNDTFSRQKHALVVILWLYHTHTFATQTVCVTRKNEPVTLCIRSNEIHTLCGARQKEILMDRARLSSQQQKTFVEQNTTGR